MYNVYKYHNMFNIRGIVSNCYNIVIIMLQYVTNGHMTLNIHYTYNVLHDVLMCVKCVFMCDCVGIVGFYDVL